MVNINLTTETMAWVEFARASQTKFSLNAYLEWGLSLIGELNINPPTMESATERARMNWHKGLKRLGAIQEPIPNIGVPVRPGEEQWRLPPTRANKSGALFFYADWEASVPFYALRVYSASTGNEVLYFSPHAGLANVLKDALKLAFMVSPTATRMLKKAGAELRKAGGGTDKTWPLEQASLLAAHTGREHERAIRARQTSRVAQAWDDLGWFRTHGLHTDGNQYVIKAGGVWLNVNGDPMPRGIYRDTLVPAEAVYREYPQAELVAADYELIPAGNPNRHLFAYLSPEAHADLLFQCIDSLKGW